MMRYLQPPTMTVVDAAGAQMGGAAKFLDELRKYLSGNPGLPVRLIGLDRPLDPRWLVRREVIARGSHGRIALNNVGFALGEGKVTLLRNALHFASSEELAALRYRPSRTLQAQAQVVRMAAHRSDVLVVPCSAMAERVVAHAPRLAKRLVVRPHPVSQAPWALSSDRLSDPPSILLPILNAPYKRLQEHLERLLAALDASRTTATVVVTAHRHEFPGLAADRRTRFTGPLRGSDLEERWRQTRAVYFPTQLESFGYPLAEARVNGLPVIAPDTSQNREIAGASLRAFHEGQPESLTAAVNNALTRPVEPDPEPFSPQAYFDWLLGPAC